MSSGKTPALLAIGPGLLMILAALAYLTLKALFDPAETIDFKYFWLAGDLWSEGQNPYGPIYAERGEALFTGSNRPTWMVYPPYWYPLAVGVAQIPYEIADPLWKAASGGMIVLGGLLIWNTLRQSLGDPDWLRTGAFALFIGAGSATAISLSLGQSAPLIFLALALFIHARMTGSRLWMALALALLMLKPHLGLAFSALALARPYWWPALSAAVVICVAASLPALLPFGLVETLRGYAGELSRYGTVDVNAPPATTGLRNLLALATGYDASAIILALVGALVALGVGLTGRHNDVSAPQVAAAETALVLAIAGLMAPLHTYDLIVMGALILLSLHMAIWAQLVLGLGLLLILRVNNLALITGWMHPASSNSPGSLLASGALVAILAASAFAWSATIRRASG